MSSRNAYQILKVHLTSLEETKNTSLNLISRFYYLQLSNVVDQLLQPLVLPLIHHGAVYGTLPWTKELKALASCRRFLRNSAVQAHVSSVRYVTLWCPVIAHAWNMLVQTTQAKWRTFHTIILFPFLLMQIPLSLFFHHVNVCHTVAAFGPSNTVIKLLS